MKIWNKIFYLAVFFIFCSSAHAKNSVEYIRYLAEQTSVNEIAENKVIRIVQGMDPVYLNFSADEKVCKEKYGDKAFEICGRSFQDILPETGQIQITPKMEGKWQWQSDFSLAFYPSKEWKADTKFSVQFGKESLPKLTVITKPVQFTTRALKPSIVGDFKFDPEHAETMMITGSVSFNYQVDRESLESKIHVVPVSTGAVTLGKMETNFHNGTLYFSIPVLKVSDKAADVKIQLFAGVQAVSGGKLASNHEYVIKVPPKSEIFKFIGSETGIEELPDLSAKQNIVAEFSLPVLPKQLEDKIHAVLLPREKVQTEEAKDNPPYKWWSFAEISPDVLKKSENLELSFLNNREENTRFIMLAPQNAVEAGRCAYLTISAPVQGPDGFVIDKDIHLLVQFDALQSVMKIMQKGSLLSLRGDKKLSLYARNADEIHYIVRQIRPEFINSYIPLLKQAQYGQVHGEMLDSMSIVHEGSLPLAFTNAEKAQFASLDLAPFLKNDKGFFHITVEAKKEGAVTAADSRFIMLSDLGLIVKADDSEENVQAYLTSLAAGKPVSGAEIEVLGANGIALFKGKTDRNGVVSLPSLAGYEREKQVVAIAAKFKDDMAVLPYVDYQFILRPQNRTDTSGKVFSETSLNGFIFTQRDIYRAGETAYFGFILKQENMNAGLENMPLLATVYASSGKILRKQKITVSKQGMGEFSCKIPENAVSGMYRFHIEKADNSASLLAKDFYVMDFTPDTIKAKLENNLTGVKKWYGREDLQDLAYTVTVENLFGSPAMGNTVKARLIASPMQFAFDNEYKDFIFYDAGKAEKSNVQELGSFVTDKEGKADIKIDVNAIGYESLALTLQAEVFDAQGASNILVKDLLYVSPLSAVLGYKTQSNLAFLTQQEKASLEIIALDMFAKPYAMGELAVELYQSDFVKSLVKVNGKYQYTKVRREKLLSKDSAQLNGELLHFSLDTSEVGEKLLVFKDKKKRVVLQVRYTVVGDSSVQFDEYKSADLQAAVDTKEYKTGESIRVALKTPYEGSGLITIERDKVYAAKWFAADKGNSVQSIEIPEGLEGKAYINVLYFRDIEDEEIFVEPCASVVLPFTVDVSKRKLGLELEIAKGEKDFVARPGQEFTVQVRTDEPAKVLVYAVDEGIIRLTGYQRPNPLQELFLDRALSVQTYQYLDMLMPEFSLMQKQLAKFGGDMLFAAKHENALRSAGVNPFKVRDYKPAVFWSGLLDVDKKGKEIKIPVPDTYNGNMRVFAVAVSDTKANAAQKDVLCQAEIVVQPYLPFFVSPTDEFEATLLLTDMRKDKRLKDIELKMDLGSAFELSGKDTLALVLEEGKQNIVRLRIKVKDGDDIFGEKTLRFIVTQKQSGLKQTMPAMLSVRPASARYGTVTLGMLSEKNKKYAEDIVLSRKLYPQFAMLSASVSSAPIPYVQALLQRNAWFCYPSTVQRVAKAMPLLYLLENKQYAPKLDDFSEEKIRSQIMECLQILESRYTYRNVFYRWDNYGSLSVYELAFVFDFLTTAREKGFALASYLFEDIKNALQEKLAHMPSDLEEARAIAYGAWGLTRNGIITSQIMANLTTWLEQNVKNWESDIAASLMAGSMKLMMQDELAGMFIEKYMPAMQNAGKYPAGFDSLSERALYGEIVAKHFPEKLESEKSGQYMQELYSLLQEYFAQSSEALAIRTIIETGARQDVETIASYLAFADKAGNVVSSDVAETEDTVSHGISLEDSDGIVSVNTVRIQAEKPLFYQVSVSGYDKDRFAGQGKQAFSVTREYRDADGAPVKAFRVGEEVVVVIKAKSQTGKSESVMITDILPAAFEFITVPSAEPLRLGTMQGGSDTGVLQEEAAMQVEFADKQEDRALLFATLENRETVFSYKVRVSSKGNFVLPDITVQSVENPLLYARDLTIKDTRIVAE